MRAAIVGTLLFALSILGCHASSRTDAPTLPQGEAHTPERERDTMPAAGPPEVLAVIPRGSPVGGREITFQAVGNYSLASWEWDFDGGATLRAPAYSVAPITIGQRGRYRGTVRGIDVLGNVSEAYEFKFEVGASHTRIQGLGYEPHVVPRVPVPFRLNIYSKFHANEELHWYPDGDDRIRQEGERDFVLEAPAPGLHSGHLGLYRDGYLVQAIPYKLHADAAPHVVVDSASMKLVGVVGEPLTFNAHGVGVNPVLDWDFGEWATPSQVQGDEVTVVPRQRGYLTATISGSSDDGPLATTELQYQVGPRWEVDETLLHVDLGKASFRIVDDRLWVFGSDYYSPGPRLYHIKTADLVAGRGWDSMNLGYGPAMYHVCVGELDASPLLVGAGGAWYPVGDPLLESNWKLLNNDSLRVKEFLSSPISGEGAVRIFGEPEGPSPDSQVVLLAYLREGSAVSVSREPLPDTIAMPQTKTGTITAWDHEGALHGVIDYGLNDLQFQRPAGEESSVAAWTSTHDCPQFSGPAVFLERTRPAPAWIEGRPVVLALNGWWVASSTSPQSRQDWQRVDIEGFWSPLVLPGPDEWFGVSGETVYYLPWPSPPRAELQYFLTSTVGNDPLFIGRDRASGANFYFSRDHAHQTRGFVSFD